MKVFIVGLGLIGASYADKLTQEGYEVYGHDKDASVMEKAKSEGVIHEESTLAHIKDADLVIIALYPTATIEFLKNTYPMFNETQTITDVCGVKTSLINKIETFYPSTQQKTQLFY